MSERQHRISMYVNPRFIWHNYHNIVFWLVDKYISHLPCSHLPWIWNVYSNQSRRYWWLTDVSKYVSYLLGREWIELDPTVRSWLEVMPAFVFCNRGLRIVRLCWSCTISYPNRVVFSVHDFFSWIFYPEAPLQPKCGGSRGPASSPPGFNPGQYPTPNYLRIIYSELIDN